VTIGCNDGSVHITQDCKKACGTDLVVQVTVTDRSGTKSESISPPAQIYSGNTDVQDCSTLVDETYSGSISLQCSGDGQLAATASCEIRCLAGATVDGIIGSGATKTVAAIDTIASGSTEMNDCEDYLGMAFSGTAQLDCAVGVLTADISGCSLACLDTTTVSVALRSTTGASINTNVAPVSKVAS